MKTIKTLALASATLTLAACAGMMTPKTPEEAVMARAQERNDALMQKDMKGLEKAWSFTSPSYRQSTTAGQYNALVAGRGMWNAAKVKSVSCEESVCDVVTLITYTSPQLGLPITRPLDEKWINIGGKWWIYHK